MTDREYVDQFAAKHGLVAQWEGEIGFGRECVGLLDSTRHSYVAWRYDDKSGPPVEVSDAYHKGPYIAVLGRGEHAEAQLAAWCRHLEAEGATFERRAKDIPDLASLVYGHSEETTAVTG